MFGLTAAQALQAGLLEPAVGFVEDGPARPSGPWSISLEELKLESPCPDLRQPITGTISFRSQLPRLPEICLRLEISLQVAGSEALREASFFAYPRLRPERIQFEFDPLKKGNLNPRPWRRF